MSKNEEDYPVLKDGGREVSKPEQIRMLDKQYGELLRSGIMLMVSNEEKTIALILLGLKLNAHQKLAEFHTKITYIDIEFDFKTASFNSECFQKHEKWTDYRRELTDMQKVYPNSDGPHGEVWRGKMNTDLSELEYFVEWNEHAYTKELNRSRLIQWYFDKFVSWARQRAIDFNVEKENFENAKCKEHFSQMKWRASCITDEMVKIYVD